MAFSLMNGLSAMGAGVAQFAGQAGLEYQKADLANKAQILADQLATTRETKLQGQRQEFQGAQTDKEIAARSAAATQEQASAMERTKATIAGTATNVEAEQLGATKRNDATLAAASETRQQEILASRQKTALEAVQTQNAQDLRDAHAALQAETAKPDADPAKISNLTTQITSLEKSATTEAATTTALAAMYRTDMDAVQHYNTQLVTATAAYNAPGMTDEDRTAQKGLIGNLQTQLKGAQIALKQSSDQLHGRIGAATGTPTPGVPPPPPAGVPVGARYNFDAKIWQSPDGRLFDAQGKPTTAPGGKGYINTDPQVVN